MRRGDSFAPDAMRIDSPSSAMVEQAYFALGARGTIVVACPFDTSPGALRALEAAGFHGMRLRRDGEAAEVTAFKGKEGPCYDTGRSARYAGEANPYKVEAES